MNDANAWLLNFGAGLRAAIGIRDLVYTFYHPETCEVPEFPSHRCRALLWRQHRLPVWDLRTWLDGDAGDTWPYAAVVAYRGCGRQLQEYGALRLAAPPLKVRLEDEDMCPLPEPEVRWHEVASCCFGWRRQPTPVLDLQRMFSEPGATPVALPVASDLPLLCDAQPEIPPG
ncbi:MAG TPA: hypothetical protein VHP13_05535 [Gammaproteobacteria bacterium]|nr:hypothetical protein [Gammaproteobacteria bacterium]